MRKAKLIKQRDCQRDGLKECQKERADQPDNAEPRKELTAVETAKEWVKAYQTAERLSPRKRFAALFS